jgi:cytochrome c oxidase subunit 2
MLDRRLAPLLLAAPLAACEGVQTAAGGQGEHSQQFITLFTIFLVVCAAMYVLVIGGLLAALFRRRRGYPNIVEAGLHHRSNPMLKPVLAGWTALVVLGLAGLTLASFVVDRSQASARAHGLVVINVTAHQFWWDVEYVTLNSSIRVKTANELHLPVNVPLHVRLKSSDVIHSLWIPNLAGKQDLIPGRETDLKLLPRKTGLYRGRCAEFCGVQHTHMALDVTVESRRDFESWYKAQLQPAVAPSTPLARAGFEYVTRRECRMCHNITGTPANGRVAPDLTHVASRRSIAAGTLPMNRGNLYAWVADPQAQKPGNHMPTVGMTPTELHAVIAYLEGLK